MNWLLSNPIRPFVALAAFASLLFNLALVVPVLYLLQVFERVFVSRSVETLAMLTLFALLAVGLAFAMDRVRSLLLARAGRSVDEALSGRALSTAVSEAARGSADPARCALPDIARLRSFLCGPAVQALFDAPWLPVYLLVIFLLHPALGWAATASAAALLSVGWLSERLVRRDAERATIQARAAGRRIDALHRNAEVLLGMAMLGNAIASWSAMHRQVQRTQERLASIGATLGALSRALRQLVQVAMLGLGAWLVLAGDASPGIIIAATLLLGRALQPIEQLVAGWKSLVEVRAAWRRLHRHVVDALPSPALSLPALRGEVRLERVTVLADQRPAIIRGVSLQLQPGECLGLVGPSGAGKTTLVRLMLGLREPHAGKVRLDGVELSNWPLEQLEGAIGYLPQDVELFDDTVARNIARLGPVDAGAVIEAARLAGVHDMIARLPQAYDTELGDAGSLLSGGQRQRIALARAVYGAPRLVVLDEPNANLDAEGEEALHATLLRLKERGATVVLVSHKPALMVHADTLALLRDGTLEIVGRRDEVLARLSGSTMHDPRRPSGADGASRSRATAAATGSTAAPAHASPGVPSHDDAADQCTSYSRSTLVLEET